MKLCNLYTVNKPNIFVTGHEATYEVRFDLDAIHTLQSQVARTWVGRGPSAIQCFKAEKSGLK